jgi:hypothetical protein
VTARILLLAAGMLAASAVLGEPERVDVGQFSLGRLKGWATRDFRGHTIYALAADAQGKVLAAECRNSASAYYRAMKVDLARTPVLHWSWRIERPYGELDERKKSGDDYPARVYVVVRDGPMAWQVRAVNYVWSSRQPAGASWSSAYTRRNVMIALRSGAPAAENNGWQSESRDVRRDFKAAFGRDAGIIDGVAVMTDCDDSHGTGKAWYGDIWFAAR